MVKKISAIIICVVLIFTTVFYISTKAKADGDVKVPIILYHNLTNDPNLQGKPLLNITPQNFYLQMKALKDNGWNTITFDEYYNHVENNAELPPNPIIISFDDGYESVYDYAYPTLKELGMQATLFVITSRMGAGVSADVTYPHFSWDQAREMEASGFIDIESHSDTHINMFDTNDTDRIQVEFRKSKYLIETNLNKECDVFAFPYGGDTDYARQLGLAAGYKMLCLVGDQGSNSAGDQIDRMKRITISGDETPQQMLDTITKNLK